MRSPTGWIGNLPIGLARLFAPEFNGKVKDHQQDACQRHKKEEIGDILHCLFHFSVLAPYGSKGTQTGYRQYHGYHRGHFINQGVLRLLGNMERRNYNKAKAEKIGGRA